MAISHALKPTASILSTANALHVCLIYEIEAKKKSEHCEGEDNCQDDLGILHAWLLSFLQAQVGLAHSWCHFVSRLLWGGLSVLESPSLQPIGISKEKRGG